MFVTQELAEKNRIKLTREDGTDCWSGKIKYEVGETVEAPDWEPNNRCGHGIHFGHAATCFRSLESVFRKPGKAFLVEPMGQVIEICEGKYKARAIKVVKELNLQEILTKAGVRPLSVIILEDGWCMNLSG